MKKSRFRGGNDKLVVSYVRRCGEGVSMREFAKGMSQRRPTKTARAKRGASLMGHLSIPPAQGQPTAGGSW